LGAKALFLPEASDYIASSASESISLARTPECSAFVTRIRDAAREHNIAVNVGVHEPATTHEHDNESSETKQKVKNVSIWIDEKGELLHKYQKLHLFDIDIGDGRPLKESDSVEAGKEILPAFKTPVGNVGLLICFDLRFPEPSLRILQSDPKPDILTYPSAFTIPTGKVHWMPLLQARAIETQCYVVAAAQVGQHNEKRASYGHGVVIGPWGEVLAELSGEWKGEPDLAIVEVNSEDVDAARKKIPLARRWDVYNKP
jgi:predicted amidohydrolase